MMRIRKNEPYDVLFRDDEIIAAAKVSDALAHPARIRMLRYILTENVERRIVTNKDLVLAFDYAQATISQHLSKLMVGGLLEVQKKGTSSCYFARVGRLSAFMETLKKIDTREEESELPDFLRAELFEFEPETIADALAAPGEELHPEDLIVLEDDVFGDAQLYL